MSSIIYLLGIIIILASAVFSVMNADKHKQLTKQTYDYRVKNDALQNEIAQKEGRYLKLDDFIDEGDTPLGKNDDSRLSNSIALIRQRSIVGQVDPLKFAFADGETPNRLYVREVDGQKLSFSPFNQITATPESTTKFEQEITFVKNPATDIVTSKAIVTGSEEVAGRLGAYIDNTLNGQIKDLNRDIGLVTSSKGDLEEQINVYVEAEKRISTLFAAEGISTLQGGKDKLEELEGKRKSLLDEQDVLEKEGAVLAEKSELNTEVLGSQSDYFGKRKLNIGANSKFFKLAAVDFDWGFVIINAGDAASRFYINQDLLILRGNSYIGTVKVSSVEPDRVMANIEYDSVVSGMVFRKGDKVFLAESIDR